MSTNNNNNIAIIIIVATWPQLNVVVILVDCTTANRGRTCSQFACQPASHVTVTNDVHNMWNQKTFFFCLSSASFCSIRFWRITQKTAVVEWEDSWIDAKRLTDWLPAWIVVCWSRCCRRRRRPIHIFFLFNFFVYFLLQPLRITQHLFAHAK